MKFSFRIWLFLAIFSIVSLQKTEAQPSVARQWNEALIQAIRTDFARPPVHARNLFHVSLAMYDAWAAFDEEADTYLLGKTVGGFNVPFVGINPQADIEASRRAAVCYAAYRVLYNRFQFSPNAFFTIQVFYNQMVSFGYNPNFTSTDYTTGNPAALGNYIGQKVIEFGMQDGSNQANNYANQFYQPSNPTLIMDDPGNAFMIEPNLWQPLQLATAIDQNGNPIPSIQVFQSPEWGDVLPFALNPADLKIYVKNNHAWKVYHDPGPQPKIDVDSALGTHDEFVWSMSLVSSWGAHLDPSDGVMWDISPRSLGNNTSYPQTLAEQRDFYDFENGGDHSTGRPLNPKTGLPYEPQIVPRGDYTRVLAQFWADGPMSETPPGHWFSIFNHAMDHPDFVRKFNGKGETLDPLEYDVKAYFALGGAVHDAAVTAWGIKGWYDAVRPVSAIRYMAGLGQSSDPNLPHYHKAGLKLVPGKIELVTADDPLVGANMEHLDKIKIYTFRGPQLIVNPATDVIGVGWILAENFWPYQRKTFVTPPFGGYISGHSTYSRSAAEILTHLTGDEYFPGGMGEFKINKNSGFLGLEAGPSMDVTLQWATYRDASDQTSLSRIWGGIHPPFDDIPGRLIGIKIGEEVFDKVKTMFYDDVDGDGFYSYEDCNDTDPLVSPASPEICDFQDNDCDFMTDEDLPEFVWFYDADVDGFGDPEFIGQTCSTEIPDGFVADSTDCDDSSADINPATAETCDGLDQNCNDLADENLPLNSWFADVDGDGFGQTGDSIVDCYIFPPLGYVGNNLDCNDTDTLFSPAAAEICDNQDQNCNGLVDDGLQINNWYFDADSDGSGDGSNFVSDCQNSPPSGYVKNALDCNDANAQISPSASEICDEIDNDCNGLTDDGLQLFLFFADSDGDGFGDKENKLYSCENTVPTGFVTNDDDCNDQAAAANPNTPEICDGLDNDCDGENDENLPQTTWFADADGDGFGNPAAGLDTCTGIVFVGYVGNSLDCNDTTANANPDAEEIIDGIDNDCNGIVDDVSGTNEPVFAVKIFPNPVSDWLTINWFSGENLRGSVFDVSGKLKVKAAASTSGKSLSIDFSDFVPGVYFLKLEDVASASSMVLRLVKI